MNMNVALKRPSWQSSNAGGNHGCCLAPLANDGNTTTNLFFGSCAHTNDDLHSWWAVDLGVPLYVQGVNFTNRGDCCGQCSCTRRVAQYNFSVLSNQNVESKQNN